MQPCAYSVPRATGVTTAMVEAMEHNFKRDVLRELRAGKGRILLHDEVEERPGVFSIIPLWEEVEEKDILTPRDVFSLMTAEGFKVNYVVYCKDYTLTRCRQLDYGRIAIVRIQPCVRCFANIFLD